MLRMSAVCFVSALAAPLPAAAQHLEAHFHPKGEMPSPQTIESNRQ